MARAAHVIAEWAVALLPLALRGSRFYGIFSLYLRAGAIIQRRILGWLAQTDAVPTYPVLSALAHFNRGVYSEMEPLP